MKRFVIIVLTLSAILFMAACANGSKSDNSMLERAPQLEISRVGDNASEHRVQAAQLTTSWRVEYKDGTGKGYEADAVHALQLSDYEDCTLKIDDVNGRIMLSFSDNYPPQSVSAKRWDALYTTGDQDILSLIDKGEPVEIDGSIIHVSSDGLDYVYEVNAIWEQGSSYYAFILTR